jgi:cytochrome c oxidase assembly protein subunit 15
MKNNDHAGGALEPKSFLLRHVFACFLAASTAFLIFWGALVPSHDAGLSVPDWPTSYGKWWLWLHEMEGNIFWEHMHRVIAASVGFLTLSFALWTGWAEPRRWVRWLSYAALAAVVAQGILGGITVHYMLPTPISVSHACLAQIFFCMTIALAFVTSPLYVRGLRGSDKSFRGARRLAAGTVALVFLQLLIGAIMRHTDSGLAVPDFPYAYGDVKPGQLWPALDDASVAAYNRHRMATFTPIFDEDHFHVDRFQILVHMLHRAGALLVTTAILTLAGFLLARHRDDLPLGAGAIILLGLVFIQITLGIYTVWTRKAPFVASFHVFFGALILGCVWFLALRIWTLERRGAASGSSAKDMAAENAPRPRRGAQEILAS